ncbi:MAG: hypothetical protein QN193_05645 [Armatimonadota bacterium]|nr:hypothetical protein [Armatimonadota bacterium]MDR7443976.1 hypothetical protein [Armatimonadota bacterium]MDR7570074.1 hypothetical protein [Armatimonadota bacterium]MDR7615421.1 hypothetical protein [Armatimonadota bacterium]
MAESQRYVVFVHAGPQELARALHALLYARELTRAGIPAKIVFDGAGTVWLQQFSDPQHKYHGLFREVLEAGLVDAACAYCARAFNVVDAVRATGVPLVDTADGHPSLASYVQQGWIPLTL